MPAETEVPPGVWIERFGPGEGVESPLPGDFILVSSRGWFGDAVCWFQRLRFRGPAERRYARWSHAAIVTHPSGRIVECGTRGVVFQHVEKYRARDYRYVHIGDLGARRIEVATAAESFVGMPYGRLAFVGLALSLLSGDRIRLRDKGQQGCVSVVARALLRAGARFDRSPVELTPADLARHYGVVR